MARPAPIVHQPLQPMTLMKPDTIIQTLSPQVADRRLRRFREVCDARMSGLTVVCESLFDPGNRSAIYRSAEAFGLLDVHVVDPDAAYKRHARAVSRGAEKWLNIHEWETPDECVEALRADGFRIFVSDLQAARPLSTLPFDRPAALVFGTEHSGISDRMRELADEAFIIPMRGFVESLNVSTAAAIAIAHARTERERALGGSTDLPWSTRHALYADCIEKSARGTTKLLNDAESAAADDLNDDDVLKD